MNIRTTFILLLVVAGLGAYVFWVDRRMETTREREEQARKALQIEPGRITAFTVAATNLQVTCAQTNGQWRVIQPITARADAAAVDRLLSALERMPRGEVITPAQRQALQVFVAGADGLAVISAVVGRPDVEAAARELKTMISSFRHEKG